MAPLAGPPAEAQAATAAFCWHSRGSWSLTGRHYRLHNCHLSRLRSGSTLAASAATLTWVARAGPPPGLLAVSRTAGQG